MNCSNVKKNFPPPLLFMESPQNIYIASDRIVVQYSPKPVFLTCFSVKSAFHNVKITLTRSK